MNAGRVQWLVFVAVGLLGFFLLKREIGNEAVLKDRIRARETVIAALARTQRRVDSVYVTDTVTLTRWRTTYNAIRDTLRLTDTVAVRQFVVVADSTIHACSVALETCERRVAVRDSVIAAKDDLLRLERKRRPSFLGGLVTKMTWAAIGYGAGRLTK